LGQNVSLALKVARRGYVLQVGKMILEDGIDAFKGSDIVKKAYMGG
jgi:ABC-type branched-subunit amino acid transport system ATPase component